LIESRSSRCERFEPIHPKLVEPARASAFEPHRRGRAEKARAGEHLRKDDTSLERLELKLAAHRATALLIHASIILIGIHVSGLHTLELFLPFRKETRMTRLDRRRSRTKERRVSGFEREIR
jgi:hypothetical protein